MNFKAEANKKGGIITFAAPRRLSILFLLMILAIVLAAFAMGEARASSLSQQRVALQEHCTMMEIADEGSANPQNDTSPPVPKGMNCAMTCAFIMAPAPLISTSRPAYSQKRTIAMATPLIGNEQQIDLPPPKA